jgi:aldose sugar dehydrogenase
MNNLNAASHTRRPARWMKPVFKLLAVAAIASIASLANLRTLADSPAARVGAAAPFWAEEVATGLNVPWSMAWLPNGDLLILEKFGGLRVMRSGRLLPEILPGTPEAYKVGPNGLLDIAIDPDFKRNQRVFITFDAGSATLSKGSLFRARFTGDALIDGKVIFQASPESTVGPHPSLTRILFLPDKTMLLGSAVDDPRRDLAQRLDTHLGKILRIDRDGRAPRDNPFVNTAGALPEIYAYGVRNPIGLFRDQQTGLVWEIENGPRGGDELNRIKPGANYGWPIATYGKEYTGEEITAVREAPGIESPVTYWAPSIAPCGVAVAGERYPQWKGDVFAGALAGQHLRHVILKDGKAIAEEILLKELDERIRGVHVGPDGYLYVLTDNTNGRLLRLHAGQPKQAQLAQVAKPLAVNSNPTVDTLNMRPLPADPSRGQQLFAQQCSSCHTVEPGAAAGIGPNLAHIMGRKAGQAGNVYSPAMRASSIKWGPATLDRFIAGPKAFIPGTTMTAAPIAQPQDRADIIAFLKQ